VTLRFERGTAFAQHIITLRSQIRALVELGQSSATPTGTVWDDPRFREHVGRLDANVEALWRMTQMGIAEAERSGMPAPSGSAVKLRYSELAQEIADLTLRTIGRPALAGAGEQARAAARDYLWSLQFTIAAGTSQIQRNLIAERILGLPR
jgi:alkylation response protein AidB-like acyl-CoA dehydrogenase